MSDPFIGEIRMVGFDFPPHNWSACDGEVLPVSQNPALASLLG
ncbi:MAG: tail fiber protein, partial [Proteobacteria bacterium]|nr:tail fiber protein [Pseudomonadota bacterium]